MQFESLRMFSRWFLAQPLGKLRAPHAAVRLYETSGGTVVGIVLARTGAFQAELFASPGAGHFPQHRHPNVDSIEIHLAGETAFVVNGEHAMPPELLHELAGDGSSLLAGRRIRVHPGDWHGAQVGPAGGLFLSLQHWKNGITPSSVGLDWEGPAHTRTIGATQ